MTSVLFKNRVFPMLFRTQQTKCEKNCIESIVENGYKPALSFAVAPILYTLIESKKVGN